MKIRSHKPSFVIKGFRENVNKKIYSKKVSKGKLKAFEYELITGEYSFRMDKKLKEDLDILSSDLSQNDDALIVVVAPEGAGKTVLETQIGFYLSQKNNLSWNENNIHFEGQDYIDFSLLSKAKTVIALDESRRALNKMRGMTNNNVDFMNFLSECRDQNQIHIIVLPAYSDLEKYVGVHRVKYIIQVIKERDKVTKKIKRGKYKIISTKSKQMLLQAWKGGYKEFPNNMVIKTCYFDNVLCLDETKYKKKKKEAKEKRYSSNNNTKKKMDWSPEKIRAYALRNQGMKWKDIALELNMTTSSVTNWGDDFKNFNKITSSN